MKTSIQQLVYKVCTAIVIYNSGQFAIDTIAFLTRMLMIFTF